MDCPRSLRVAAALVAVEGLALAVLGLVYVVRALVGHPHDRGTAVLLGVVLAIYGVGVVVAALGLRRARRWAQTPTYLVQFFTIVVSVGQLHTLPGLTAPLIALAVATLVAVSLPASRRALGGI